MILSHSHRFIFLKTRKTGGTSFEIALSKYASPEDVVTPIAPDDEKIRASLGHAGPQNCFGETGPLDPATQRPLKFYNHMEGGDVRARVPADVFANYTKVSIVRNPFDYAVSWYYWEQSRSGPTSREDFRNWLMLQHARRPELEAAYRQRRRPNPGVFASNRFITHIDGKSVIDFMIRYEAFESDVGRFARQAQLPESLYGEFRDINAKGSYRPASATSLVMFEDFPDGQQLIKTSFAEEIETYGYALA